MIPRKLALRIWAACLRDQGRVLTGQQRPAHRTRSVSSSAIRSEQGRKMLGQADTIEGWTDDGAGPGRSDLCAGADLSDEVVATVSAYLYRHGDAVRRVKWWLDNRGVPEPADVTATIRAIMEIH